MQSRLLESLYLLYCQRLDVLTIVYQLIGGIRILCSFFRVITRSRRQRNVHTYFLHRAGRQHLQLLADNLISQTEWLANKFARGERPELPKVYCPVHQ